MTAATAESAAPTAGPPTRRARLGLVLAVLWVAIATATLASGLEYYRGDAAARAYSELRVLYAPTGVIGHSLGYLGAASVVIGVTMYVLRKRWRVLHGRGALSSWLQVHIFLCTLGPYLVLLHTSFKFHGVAAISFWSMTAAVASGIVGRYLYAHIPRTIHGNLRTLDGLAAEAAELEQLLGDVAPRVTTALAPVFAERPRPPRSLAKALVSAARGDLERRLRLRRARAALRRTTLPRAERERVVALVRHRMRVEQQIALLAPFQRLFHYWHVLHLPMAIVMFLALALHMAVAFAFGYGWPF